MEIDIEQLIRPENDLESKIIADPEWIKGALHGKPRPGHPEGEVINHICEVLANVEKYSTDRTREVLRLITIIHDTFKYKVDNTQSKSGENHHAMIARRYAEKIGITDKETLDIIELHDEAYNAWCKGDRDNKWSKAEDRGKALIKRLDAIHVDTLDLYCTFYKCDNETGDKTQANVEWFDDLILKG